MKSKLILILTFIPTLSFAKPAYMNCFVKNEDNIKHSFSVLVDKNNRKISHKNENGNTYNTEAFFTKDTVRYLYNVNSSESRITFAYVINLSSFTVQKIVTIRTPYEITKESGSCEILTKNK